MIETDSYLYTANNDRDDAGSDKHNSKHIHPHFMGNDKGLICYDEKVAYLTFEGRKEAKKIVKTTFLQKK